MGFVLLNEVSGENSRGREFDKEEQAERKCRRICDDAAAKCNEANLSTPTN